jgi:hypothetical protein
VGLSEWKAKAIEAGCLVSRDLLERARPIEQLLEEREWREGHLKNLEIKDQLYGDTFFYAAKILLASVIDGPFPSSKSVSKPKFHRTLMPSPRHLTGNTKHADNPPTTRRYHSRYRPISRSGPSNNDSRLSRWNGRRRGFLQRAVRSLEY